MFQWTMSFNPDPLNKKLKFVFPKSNVINHVDLVFNNSIVHKALYEKHLGLILDDKLKFNEHINKNFC